MVSTSTRDDRDPARRRRMAVRATGLLAGATIGWASYDFGHGLGGLWFGLLLGANGAVFGALVAAGLVDRWFTRRGDGPPRGP